MREEDARYQKGRRGQCKKHLRAPLRELAGMQCAGTLAIVSLVYVEKPMRSLR